MKKFLKRVLPEKWLLGYHKMLALGGAYFYGFPSRKLKVIGVTGTNGKTTVCHMIRGILEKAGYKVGMTTSIDFSDGEKTWENNTKQGMPGRFQLRKLLARMVENQCQYAVIETTSEGIKQYRHYKIDYDIAVLTNVTRDHIEAHGSFAAYRQAKEELFKIVAQNPHGISIVNLDDPNAHYFLRHKAMSTYGYSLQQKKVAGVEMALGEIREATGDHSVFTLTLSSRFSLSPVRIRFRLNLAGKHNVDNALAAFCVGLSQKIDREKIVAALAGFRGLAGRLEEIKNQRGFRVFVDYAHTEDALAKVYEAIKQMKPQRVIAVLGATGGGRDKKKRPFLGMLAAQYADLVWVTNEDPYDEDPRQIIDEVFAGVIKGGKQEGRDAWRILDRGQAINQALAKAGPGDIVVITGKGCERVMAVKGRMIPWDDREMVRKYLREQPIE